MDEFVVMYVCSLVVEKFSVLREGPVLLHLQIRIFPEI